MGGRPPSYEQMQELNGLMQSLVANYTFSRQGLARAMSDPRRDIDDECGYPKTVSPELLYELYLRDPIAGRVVELMPKKAWQVQPTITDDLKAKKPTAWQQTLLEVMQGLRGEQSRHRDAIGNPFWDTLVRASIAAGIGQYGVILLGLNDGAYDLSMPVAGVQEMFSTPAKVKPEQGEETPKPQGVYNLTVNRAAVQRKLLYMRPFPEALAQVVAYETNPTSPRHCMPTMYLLTFNDPREQELRNGMPATTMYVHWTRVVHIATDILTTEMFGTPRQRPVLNNILNIRKLSGASPEGYWKSCFTGLVLKTQPQLAGEVVLDRPALRNEAEQFQNGLQRILALVGMDAQPIAPQVVDPTPHIERQIELICIKLGIPVRIFKGSERGELSSGQDEDQFDDDVKAYQLNVETPRVVVPVVDRLIMLGVLPETKGYYLQWPDITKATALEKANVASIAVTTIGDYVQTGAHKVMSPEDLYKELGKTDEEAAALVQRAKEAEPIEPDPEPEEPTDNTFCPTGKGGGVDPSCSGGGATTHGTALSLFIGQKSKLKYTKVQLEKIAALNPSGHGSGTVFLPKALKPEHLEELKGLLPAGTVLKQVLSIGVHKQQGTPSAPATDNPLPVAKKAKSAKAQATEALAEAFKQHSALKAEWLKDPSGTAKNPGPFAEFKHPAVEALKAQHAVKQAAKIAAGKKLGKPFGLALEKHLQKTGIKLKQTYGIKKGYKGGAATAAKKHSTFGSTPTPTVPLDASKFGPNVHDLQGANVNFNKSPKIHVDTSKLSGAEKSAVRGWSNGQYSDMRKRIAAGKLEKEDHALLAGLNKLPKYEGQLYRGIKAHSDYGKNLIATLTEAGEGAVYVDAAPASLSRSPSVATGFASGGIFLSMKSKTARSIEPLSNYGWEDESVSLPGTKYKVTKVERNVRIGGSLVQMVVHMEEM
jgi:uncharacterized protein